MNQPVDLKSSLHREAPLVHLVTTDLTTLTQVELEAYLVQLREMRSSPQTVRAKTERAPKKSQNVGFDKTSML